MAKHIRNYSVVKKAMREYFDREEKTVKKRLDDAEKALKECEGTEYEIAECKRRVRDCREHLEKFLPKYRARWESRLEAADKAGRLLEINIQVEWSRSRTWGMNPHAQAWVCFEDEKYGTRSTYGKGSASGCGYDKRSAAVHEALCLSCSKRDYDERKENLALGRASIDRFVIEHGEALWNEYAVDRTPLPHLSFSGKGMSTFTRLFRRIGYKPYGEIPVPDFFIDYRESDSGSDVYHIIRKDRI